MARHYLSQLFAPQSIAVFGASQSPDSVGARVFENLKQGGYPGRIHAINPKYTTINGDTCHPSIKDINECIDLAVITTPAHTIVDIIRACGDHGVSAAIVISAGFAERGAAGHDLKKTVIELGRQRGFGGMNGEVIVENIAMLQLVKDLGFTSVQSRDDPAVRLVSKTL